ncbi:hypothetical protein Goshw_003407 [Gossypium schwendimanii]|uniref:Uncharacterized protein n=1 Tax=Gossypium schwendimanii TaxID=34291 RepID=A0A7J9KPX0_GOSSC|nr:hypothetical protein [Gossypium schwendimanii]
MAKARYLLQERNYRIRTDGRRIMAYYSRISDKDDKSICLLKKIAIYLQFITMADVNKDSYLIHIPTKRFGKVEVIMMEATINDEDKKS